MSRTTHHSRKYGRDHKWADRLDRGRWRSTRDASEARNMWSHLHDIIPGRRADNRTLGKLKSDPDLWDTTVMPYTGTRRPHEYDW